MRAFRLGNRTIDLPTGRVVGGDAVATLTPTESRLLHHLSRRNGELVSREELLVHVWGYAATVRSRTIDTTIARVRAKLEDHPAQPRFLHTVYGRGVRLVDVEPLQPEPGPSFVGRRPLVDALVEAVGHHRLTTVWGPPGSGKSRLVSEGLPRLGLGAVLVDCSAATDLDLAVAEALGVDGAADLGRALERDCAVLLLDGCESAVDAVASRVRTWLARAPRLRIATTSRTELRVPGEHLLEVGPLPSDEAVALFVERARGLDAIDRSRIEKIVARLDHLPFAIELAASQLHLLGLDRLEALLPTIGEEGGSIVARSFARLTDEDRAVLLAASLFEGPFDHDDLAGVAGGQVLRRLDSLVRQSLIQSRAGRLRVYALVRDHARSSLAADHPARERHARWFGRLGEPEVLDRARSDAATRSRLWAAAADLRVAFATAIPLDRELAARCGLALLWCATRRGRLAEGQALAEQLDTLPCTGRSRLAVGLLTAALYRVTGDDREALDRLAQLGPLASSPEDHVSVRCATAISHGRLGDREAARRELELARPHAAAVNRAQLLGTIAFHTEPPDDERKMREALGIARTDGNLIVEIECLGALAAVAHERHADWETGRRSFRHLLELCASDDALVRYRVRAFLGLGLLERAQGDLDAAEACLEHVMALAERHEVGDVAHLARVELARVWNQGGRHDDALALVEPLAAAERPAPHRATARTLLATAEILERLGEVDAARRLLLGVLHHAGEARVDYAADALDLLGLLDGDEGMLVTAAQRDDRRSSSARRHLFTAVLAARAGDSDRAARERAAAHDAIARLGLLPHSDAATWLRRLLPDSAQAVE